MSKRLLVAEQWDSFARAILPEGCPAIQRQEMRRAFYGGAQGLFYALLKVLDSGLDPSLEPTEGDLAMLGGIERELSDFAESVKAGRA